MESVEHVGYLQAVLVGKNLLAVEIFVGGDGVVGQQAHYDTEKVFLTVDHILGVVEGGVLGIIHFQVAVDYAHPHQVGVVGRRFAVELLHAVGYAGRLAAGVAVAVAGAAAHDRRRA